MTTPVDPEPPPPKRGRPTKEERLKARRSLRDDALNIPNLLTFGRILVIPIVLLLLDRGTPEDCLLAALVYSAAALTDLIDGWLARKLNIVSMLGKFLDPLADKLLVMAVLVYMVPMGRMPEWAVVLLLAREISVTGLRGIASNEGVVIAAGDDGKTKTALQMVGILCLLLGYPYHLTLGPIDLGVVDLVVVGRILVYVSLFFSLMSAFTYTRLFAEAVDAKNEREKGG
ncbi:MAG TPA: CDP-diacylglycerol--glycerol-3-phosphate 3-phosphatidyltransferase [Longimicrobiales bacterium]|nr:CDP-diacylglycerol--glycerol-3-phosphate 3-phosphatidyltransferase [Longimicrobiales bacterium]